MTTKSTYSGILFCNGLYIGADTTHTGLKEEISSASHNIHSDLHLVPEEKSFSISD
jgi:hypothetical protein